MIFEVDSRMDFGIDSGVDFGWVFNRSDVCETASKTLVKNQSKTHPKSCQNVSESNFRKGSGQLLGASGLQDASHMLPRRRLDASREALGPISGRFYYVLGASWRVLGRLVEVLGILGLSLGSLGLDFQSKRELH